MKKAKATIKKTAKKAPGKPAAISSAKPAAKSVKKPVAKVAAKKANQAPDLAKSKAAPTPKSAPQKSAPQVMAANAVAEITSKAKSALKRAVDSVKAVNQALSLKVKETAPPKKITTLKEALAGAIKPARELEPDVITRETKDPADITDQERKSLLRKLSQAGNNFENVYKIAKTIKAKPYKMTEFFEAKTPIQHKVLGWGFILVAENNRIQVLFKDGIKTLIMNYQR